MRKIFLLAVLAFILGFLFSPAQATMYANQVINIGRGDTSIGNFPGYYGGQYPGNFPVQLSLAQAEAAVLGAPDTTFLSLPGMNGTTSFINYPYAFVQVGFASNFSANNFLEITELGASQESARVWVFTTDGSNVQFDVTRNGIDTISVDLSPYAGFMNMHGGAFTSLAIGGIDLLGSSYGFDLDAVGVAAVPLPGSLLLLGSGLFGLAGLRRFRKS